VDVTLSSEGKSIRAHKIILSACSQYFRHLFKVQYSKDKSLRAHKIILSACSQYFRHLFKVQYSKDKSLRAHKIIHTLSLQPVLQKFIHGTVQ
jgi:hypothetical protein